MPTHLEIRSLDLEVALVALQLLTLLAQFAEQLVDLLLLLVDFPTQLFLAMLGLVALLVVLDLKTLELLPETGRVVRLALKMPEESQEQGPKTEPPPSTPTLYFSMNWMRCWFSWSPWTRSNSRVNSDISLNSERHMSSNRQMLGDCSPITPGTCVVGEPIIVQLTKRFLSSRRRCTKLMMFLGA